MYIDNIVCYVLMSSFIDNLLISLKELGEVCDGGPSLLVYKYTAFKNVIHFDLNIISW